MCKVVASAMSVVAWFGLTRLICWLSRSGQWRLLIYWYKTYSKPLICAHYYTEPDINYWYKLLDLTWSQPDNFQSGTLFVLPPSLGVPVSTISQPFSVEIFTFTLSHAWNLEHKQSIIHHIVSLYVKHSKNFLIPLIGRSDFYVLSCLIGDNFSAN